MWWLKCHKCFCAIAIASLPDLPRFCSLVCIQYNSVYYTETQTKEQKQAWEQGYYCSTFCWKSCTSAHMEQCFLRQSSCQLQLFLLQVTRAFGEKYAFGKAVRALMTLSNMLRCSQSVSHSKEFHEALLVLCTLLAPMAPHISSELWEGECGTSVHQLETLFATLNWYSSSLSAKQEHFYFFFGLKKDSIHMVYVVMMCLQLWCAYSKPMCCDVFTVNIYSQHFVYCSTVKPLKTDPQKSGQPLYSGQIACPWLILP